MSTAGQTGKDTPDDCLEKTGPGTRMRTSRTLARRPTDASRQLSTPTHSDNKKKGEVASTKEIETSHDRVPVQVSG